MVSESAELVNPILSFGSIFFNLSLTFSFVKTDIYWYNLAWDLLPPEPVLLFILCDFLFWATLEKITLTYLGNAHYQLIQFKESQV